MRGRDGGPSSEAARTAVGARGAGTVGIGAAHGNNDAPDLRGDRSPIRELARPLGTPTAPCLLKAGPGRNLAIDR